MFHGKKNEFQTENIRWLCHSPNERGYNSNLEKELWKNLRLNN